MKFGLVHEKSLILLPALTVLPFVVVILDFVFHLIMPRFGLNLLLPVLAFSALTSSLTCDARSANDLDEKYAKESSRLFGLIPLLDGFHGNGSISSVSLDYYQLRAVIAFIKSIPFIGVTTSIYASQLGSLIFSFFFFFCLLAPRFLLDENVGQLFLSRSFSVHSD